MFMTPFDKKTNLFFDDFFDDFDRNFFAPAPRNMAPPKEMPIKTDIKDIGTGYLLEAELPGFGKEDISVDIDENRLVISAQKSKENDETDKDGKYIRKERYFGCYKRSFALDGIDAENVSAKFENGILALTLPKKVETPTSRKLEIL